MAAGLKIRQENVEQFQKAFEEVIQRLARPEKLTQTLNIDSEIDFSVISGSLIDELGSLMPYGAGNPEPLFMASDIRVVSSRIVGKRHRRLWLAVD